jgi:mannosyltransferase
LIAVATFALCGLGIGRPSFWADEAATISAAGRPLPDLAHLVTSLDSVHGIYYLFMHGWFQIVPQTEASARIPSCLAVAAAAAGTVVFTRLLADRLTALVAGCMVAVLPLMTWAAVEARSYGPSTCVAVWTSVAVVLAVRRQGAAPWFLYGTLLFVGTILFIYTALLIPVHAVILLAIRAGRDAAIAFAATVAATVALLYPFVSYTRNQSGQVGWIGELGFPGVPEVAAQYFDNSWLFALAAALLIVAAAVRPPRLHIGQFTRPEAAPLVTALAWMAIPTTTVLAFSAVDEVVYLDKYMSFTAPGMAILLALCIVRISVDPRYVIALTLVVALSSLPTYLEQRGPHGKRGMDYSQAADVVQAHAAPEDCLLLDDTVTWVPGPIRAMVHARPAAYSALVDVAQGRPALEGGTMWSENLVPDKVMDKIGACKAIWVLSERAPELPDHQRGEQLPPDNRFARHPSYFRPAQLGFQIVERWQFNQSQVMKMVR